MVLPSTPLEFRKQIVPPELRRSGRRSANLIPLSANAVRGVYGFAAIVLRRKRAAYLFQPGDASLLSECENMDAAVKPLLAALPRRHSGRTMPNPPKPTSSWPPFFDWACGVVTLLGAVSKEALCVEETTRESNAIYLAAIREPQGKGIHHTKHYLRRTASITDLFPKHYRAEGPISPNQTHPPSPDQRARNCGGARVAGVGVNAHGK